MKNLGMMLVFVLFAVAASGQQVSKMVLNRLNPIMEVVEVNDDEKKELIAAIQKYQKKMRELRKEQGENMQTDIKATNKQYLADVKKVLGDERFTKWRQEVRKKNIAKRAKQ